MSTPKTWWRTQPLRWNGELVYVRQTPRDDYSVVHFAAGVWQTIANVALPESKPSATPIAKSSAVSLKCFSRGEQVYLFCKHGNELFYREGLVIEPVRPADGETSGPPEADNDEPLSPSLAGWTRFQRPTALPDDFDFVGMLIEGQPAVMIIEGVLSPEPVGRVYRFDGTDWSEFASLSLPLGSHAFRAEPTADGRRSHLLTSTSIGATHTYVIEPTGIRKTRGLTSNAFLLPVRVTVGCLIWAVFALGGALLLGMLHAFGTAMLMPQHTSPDYAFGLQSVKLASLRWRGIARFIDLSLIVIATSIFAGLITANFDWLSLFLFEALNMKIDHPTVTSFQRIALLINAFPVVIEVALVVIQAVWGITPGKWICRLKTVRSTLRPCGFAASLTREFLLVVDCCSALCWTPGIVSIALTNHRKRLGDLIADTIVIDPAAGSGVRD